MKNLLLTVLFMLCVGCEDYTDNCRSYITQLELPNSINYKRRCKPCHEDFYEHEPIVDDTMYYCNDPESEFYLQEFVGLYECHCWYECGPYTNSGGPAGPSYCVPVE